ncbi:MAG: hypothetical protein ABW252_11185 [Polyangiales bacterium]
MIPARKKLSAVAVALGLFAGCADVPETSEGSGAAEVARQEVVDSTARTGGSATNQPIDYQDPDLKCYKLTAYATPANKAQKYSVPTTPDLYVAFNVKAPWTGKQYIRSFKAIIDNKAVLHHWLLFKQLAGGVEGVMPNALGAHPDGEMLHGWAPGGDDMYLDKDVGMEIAANTVFQLEMHYNNRTGAQTPDASGVEICVTPTVPPNIAGLSWVGTDAIGGASATGTCTPQTNRPIKVISASPHMHKKGRHMKVTLTRAAGGVELIHDEAFDFDYQKGYLMDFTIQPGDKLTTTCTYSGPSSFGKGTNDEMCYFFSIHYPVGTLRKANLWQLIHGPNTCID